ncbi:MAG TPA: TetR/AcrR family transcriptional regulator [Pseudonocardiaceae bacterium]|jgi:AcrR family transcriptional regulator|nr:TetR/AcrR family transcriptional regulator [Pseudonocardiaceae bacterium]
MSAPEDGRPLRADARRNRLRILAAAEEVFAEHGPTASTEEVAARAAVAIGTVFRHFPTKQALLQAIMKDLLRGLTEQADTLIAQGDPATALFDFFAGLVERAARTRTVVDLLAGTGIDVRVGDSVGLLRDSIARLLALGQRAGTVRPEVRTDEVVALLASTCQGALHGGWDADLRRRTLTIVFTGLGRPQTAG